MNRKEKILAYIQSPEYFPLNLKELAIFLAVPEDDFSELENILAELESEGKIKKNKRGKYKKSNEKKIITGTLSCSARGFFAFLTPDDENEKDVYIQGENLSTALHGDRVSVMIDKVDSISAKAEGHVVEILERNSTTFSGIVKKKKRNAFQVRPDSPKIYTNVMVSESDMLDAQIGMRVIVEVTDFLEDETFGKVISVLGDADDLKTHVSSILFCENIDTEFPDNVINSDTPSKVSDKDIEGRLDLRDKLIITIDGDDARDFDDAVSLDILENKNYRLGVHIADVTHYVTENSALDSEAFKRGTSIYLPDRVIPMLPEKLSNGICSLNPHEDRLTLTVFMEITPDGVIKSHELVKSVIHSRERMTYNNVARLLDNPETELLSKYSYLLPMLKDMEKLAAALNKKRVERGSIDFDFPESEIIVDDYGIPQDIIPEVREVSHKIIEEFMLAANETIAEYAFWAEIPFVFRVHEPPSAESMRDFQHFISAFGLGLKERFSDDEPIHPKALQQVLSAASKLEESHMISTYTLRSLMKAEYKAENLGHFGLAAKYYCHFTSPIRRYPDLAIHRILKDFIDGKSVDGYTKFALSASKHSSEQERKAQNVERDVCDLMKAYYMSQYIGYIFEAKISSITDFGIFAELENSVEGLIRVEYLKDDYYIYDSEKRTLTGRHNQRTYKIGDSIDIAVARCDLLSRQIDFIPADGADMSDIDALMKKQKKREQKKIKQQRRKRR